MPSQLSMEFSGTDLWQNPDICQICGSKLGKYDIKLSTMLGPWRKGFALSVTSDGFFVVSKKFLSVALDFKGVSFIPLERGYAAINFDRRVDYEVPTSMITQDDLCPNCHQYKRQLISGYYTRKLAAHESQIGDMEIVCSRFEWGDKSLRCPDMIVGDGVRQVLQTNRFKGLHFRELD